MILGPDGRPVGLSQWAGLSAVRYLMREWSDAEREREARARVRDLHASVGGPTVPVIGTTVRVRLPKRFGGEE